jgi:DNA mismatch repair protein MutS
MAMTPMMQQFLDIKTGYKDCILFFRLGDFYEMFFEDALTASKELEITLTGRDCGMTERAPMCGVPFHSAENYINRLITKGYKVAICEQVEDVSQAKGLVRRDVVRVVTPGTLTEGSMLDERKNNYLISLHLDKTCGISIVDVSTGELFVSSITYGNIQSKMIDEIGKFMPSEIIMNQKLVEDATLIEKVKQGFQIYISTIEEKDFNMEESISLIQDRFSLGEPPNRDEGWVHSLGQLLYYLDKTSKVDLKHIREIKKYDVEGFMNIDVSSRRNLEITETNRDKTKKGSILWVLDKTKTSMGARLLRKWIEEPLIHITDIQDRLDGVSEFKEKFMIRMEIREALQGVYDLERLIGKVVMGNANCRDLVSLKYSIRRIPSIKDLLGQCQASLNQFLYNKVDLLEDVYTLIEEGISDDPPVTIKEGGIIKSGFSSQVDGLREASTQGKTWILDLEKKEREKTGIKNLKTSYNKVFGYYLEVTKSYFDLVPDYFIRKQTLANCERYITQELKDIEENVLGAEEKVKELEYSLFIEIREKILKEVARVKETASSLSILDVLSTLGEIAERENYVKPIMDHSNVIQIENGRHPVVEKIRGQESFIPNDTLLDTQDNRIAIITGPNMAGKSTYMRQVAAIVLMAQMGSFVPASFARIGVVDKIFTRVGASDDLAGGKSTFMVEMSEVANIIHHATKKSLVLLDEIGRGTSTYDGLSIAWAVIEYISNLDRIGARTLFATHYHELTELEEQSRGIKNYCISVKEKGEDIIFLRKIIRGGADGSYGIQVAKLAGIPNSIIYRAREILEKLEKADIAKLEKRYKKATPNIEGQLDIFTVNGLSDKEKGVLQTIRDLELSSLTPLDALNVLYGIQQELK